MRTICRKTVSWLLTLTMVLAFIPTVGITAMATEDENPATIYEVENDAQETPGDVTGGAIDNQNEPQDEPQDEPQNEPANEEQGEGAGEDEGFPMIRMMMSIPMLRSELNPATPTFTVPAGTYYAAQTVAIQAENGVSIYYTTNDAEPTVDSAWYQNPITVAASTTIKAIAVAGALQSEVATAAYVIDIPNPVTFGNDAYPYGANMSSSQITLKVAIESGTAESYQWQKAASRATEPADSAFTDIAGATSADYTFAPEDGAWYRCVVNHVYESKAVQAIKAKAGGDIFGRSWTKVKNNDWYISNGTMAYMISGNGFDVTGFFQKGNNKYMLQTVYGSGLWDMVTSTNGNGSGAASGGIENVWLRFSDREDYALYITVDLADGRQSFSFGSDTQLGSSSTSGSYADAAALIAIQNSDKTLHHVSMIGAASEAAAQGSDPAFVITPITADPVFWIGYWNKRKHFSFNNEYTTGPVHANGVGDTTGTIKIEGADSGMTMSWMNVTSGGKVDFMFSVGDVAATGAVKSGINYQSEEITGLDPTTDYIITIINDDGTRGEAFEIRSSTGGTAPLVGESNDNPSKHYDFIGKTIEIKKKNSEDTPKQETVAARPDAEVPNTADPNADRPININSSEVYAGTRTVTVQLDPTDTQKMGQEYCLVDDNGTTVCGWTRPGSNGKVEFTGLNPATHYTIKARVPATATTPASLPEETGVTTASEADIRIPTGDEAVVPYDGTDHRFPITVTGGNNPHVMYSTGLSEVYTDTVPSFKAGGKYIVYYKITQDQSDTIYGNYTVIINPKLTFNLNGGNVLTLSGIGGYVTAAGDDAVTVEYGQRPSTLVTEATKDAAPNFFAGWYSDSKLKNLFWFQQDFRNAPQVVSDLTLYARWAQRLSTVNGNTLNDVQKLQLQKGGVPVPSSDWIPVTNGVFNISGVPDDEYDLVLEKINPNGKSQTITAKVRVENDIITFIEGDVEFPNNNISSKVTVSAGSPAVVVGGLEKETLATSGGALAHWDFDGTHASNNPYAVLELKFENSEDLTEISDADANTHLSAADQAVHTAQTAISAVANSELEFFDISVIRTDYEDGHVPEVFTIPELQTVLEIAVPYTPESGKSVSGVYRYHNGAAESFTKLSARPTNRADYADGTFFADDGIVYIYTSKFSTYAIGTSSRGGGRAATYENVVKRTINGKYTISPVKPSYNQLVTIAPKPDEGYAIARVTVTDSKGNVISVKDNGDGTYTFRQPNEAVTIDIDFIAEAMVEMVVSYDLCTEGKDCPIWPFTDSKPTEWYHDGVHWAIDNGIMKGYNSTQFGPTDDTTRAQVATILYRLAGSPAAKTANDFVDVKSNQWYTDAINWAAEVGVVTGWKRYSDDAYMFDPNAPVTREQLAAMIYRFARLEGLGFEGLWTFNLDYKDADSVSEWANEAVCWMTMQGVITGIGGNLIDPQADASRAQVATMFMRYCEDAAK